MKRTLLTALVLLAGCGSAPDSSDAGSIDSPDASDRADASDPADAAVPLVDASLTDAAPVDAGPPADTATLEFGPHPIDVDIERTVCVVLDAGNDVARQVSAIRTHLPAGSHHMIVYRTSEDLRAEPTPCFPFADGGSAIFIAETVDAELVYPADAALEFDAHQHIKIEIHEVNYLGVPVDITASVQFDFLPLDAPPREPVHFLFTGDMGISLPPHTTTTIASLHEVPTGARIFGLTSHMHALGTHATIHDATSESDTTGPLLHETYSWAEPPLDTFSPALELASGHGLRLSCTWENTRPETVRFGLDFEDEMCFLWAYWY